MSSKELVKKAIGMNNPERIPLLYAYSHDISDIVNVEVARHFTGPECNISEWGFEWCHIDKGLTMGQPKFAPIRSWDDFENYIAPDPYDKSRFEKIKAAREKYGDAKYYKANFQLSGFTIMSMLRGFSSIMEDLYFYREKVEQLADMVFGFEEEIIKQVKGYGYDAIGLADDWGTQQGLFISPAMWREIFKPRYKKQIKLAHKYGIDVYMHSCGNIYDIIPDFVEIGLDILNPGQSEINNVKRMGENFGGKICFSCPVSYQTTGISGSKQEIYENVKDYVEYLGAYNGGLIGIIPEDSKNLGISQESFDYMAEAFKAYGKYPGRPGDVV